MFTSRNNEIENGEYGFFEYNRMFALVSTTMKANTVYIRVNSIISEIQRNVLRR